MLRVTCPSCRANIHLVDELAGKTIRCKQCQQIFTVGALPKAAEPSKPEPRRPAPPPQQVPVVHPISKGPTQGPDPLREGLQSRPSRVPPPASTLAKLAPPSARQPRASVQTLHSGNSRAWLIGGGAAGALLLVGLGVAIALMLRSPSSHETDSKPETSVAKALVNSISEVRRQAPATQPVETPPAFEEEVRPFQPARPESSPPPPKTRDNVSSPSLPSPPVAERSPKPAERTEPSPKSAERTEIKPQAPPPTSGTSDSSGSIPSELLEHLKSATVFVRVDGTEFRASGSGFLVDVKGETAYVVTNAHVIDPKIEIEVNVPRQGGPGMGMAPPGMQRYGPPYGRPGFPMGPMGQETQKIVVPIGNATITPVFWSGTKKEQSYPAKVVASDRKRDLAILKLTGCKDLAKPIDVGRAPNLQETMPVYVLGFPFGKVLATNKGNPTITIGKGSISSIRRDERDEIALVQIDGALNPGNSGGPVVDSQGRLVGVAVATINPELGSGIGFAIPTSKLTPLLPGKQAPDSPPEKLFAKGPRTYLSDLEEYNVKSGPWPFTNNGRLGDPDDTMILINGYKSPKGLSMHPPEQDYAAASYRLGKQASLFRAEVALNDSSAPLSAAVFEVWGDGKRLWKSKAINQLIYSQRCRVDVSKVDVMELRVSSTGSPLGLHSVWYEPRLLEKSTTPDK